jgi:hypothetical protein
VEIQPVGILIPTFILLVLKFSTLKDWDKLRTLSLCTYHDPRWNVSQHGIHTGGTLVTFTQDRSVIYTSTGWIIKP